MNIIILGIWISEGQLYYCHWFSIKGWLYIPSCVAEQPAKIHQSISDQQF